jgi:hypothetical protein
LLKSFFVTGYCLISLQLYSQNIPAISAFDYNKDSLIKIYGRNKIFIPQYELQCLTALSFYPELIDVKINFIPADKESTAKTTIAFLSILKSNDKHYIIYINNNKSKNGLLLQDASFNAQVGAIGHELAHVTNFKRKNFLQMCFWGIKYIFKKLKLRIENNTDISTIKHGLGYQLYDFVDFVLNHSSATESYKIFKKKNYLSPDQILQYIKKYQPNSTNIIILQ